MTILAGAVLGMGTVCFSPLNKDPLEHCNIEKDIEAPCFVNVAEEGNETTALATE